MEFIHTADWRIGHRFSGVEPTLRRQLDDGIRQALELLFIYATKKKIPLIVCAGNAFANGQLADVEHLRRLGELCAKHQDIQLIIAPGAEDPLAAGNIYSRVQQSQFPANLQVVEKNKLLTFPEKNCSIYASPATSAHIEAAPLQWLREEALDASSINIGLCYYPHYKTGDASALKLDYLACGGAARYREIDPRCHYPGPPAQLDFGEPGFPLHVKISGPGATPRIKKIPGIAPFQWIEETLHFTDDSFAEEVSRIKTGTNRQIRKLRMDGHLSIRNYIEYRDLLEAGRHGLHSIDDRVRIQPTAQDIEDLRDVNARALAQSLMELREIEPSAGLEGTFFLDRKAVADIADAIPNDEIYDQALVSLYRQFGPDGE
jgi:hypothetical protein